MSMLSRVFPPLTFRASRRAYSVFSSKPGGGRYFNSAKPHKVAPATSPANAKSAKEEPTSTADEPSSPVLTKTSDEVPAPLPPPPSPTATTPTNPISPPAQTPRTPLHPSFSAQTYPLHQFFALHRPLLQLSLPTATFFETSSASAAPFEPPSSSSTSQSQHQSSLLTETVAESEGDADADAARQLARAIAINRVSSMVDWTETLARLGDRESQEVLAAPVEVSPLGMGEDVAVEMDSTKRKRRKKMSKHKYKKRRRLQRAERRKMGK